MYFVLMKEDITKYVEINDFVFVVLSLFSGKGNKDIG